MKKIYIVFIASNYKTGSVIRKVTRGKYNHVALSLDTSLHTLYSYARCNYFEPFNGGFQLETPARYLIDGNDSAIKVCEYEVRDSHYERLLENIHGYVENQWITKYNFADLFVYPLKKHVPIERTHTCVSFVGELLELNNFMSLRQLEDLYCNHVIYEGGMREFIGEYTKTEEGYFEKRQKRAALSSLMSKNGKLCYDVFSLLLTFILQID